MTDPINVRRRIEEMVMRIERRDAYGTLIAEGTIVVNRRDLSDPSAWRSQLRRQARADRLKIRTGETQEIVWAWLCGADTAARREEDRRVHGLLSRSVPLASVHRHEPQTSLRDGLEVVITCQRCEALGYVDARAEICAGPIFEDDCPHPSPPQETALTFFSELPLWRRSKGDSELSGY